MNATTSEKHPSFTPPIPTKFFETDLEIINDATRSTGLNRSEIIRRAIRLMKRQKEMSNGYDFIVRLST